MRTTFCGYLLSDCSLQNGGRKRCQKSATTGQDTAELVPDHDSLTNKTALPAPSPLAHSICASARLPKQDNRRRHVANVHLMTCPVGVSYPRNAPPRYTLPPRLHLFVQCQEPLPTPPQLGLSTLQERHRTRRIFCRRK